MATRTTQGVLTAGWCLLLAASLARAGTDEGTQCERDCTQWSDHLLDACIAANADPDECNRRVNLYHEECLRDICQQTLPGPTCEEICTDRLNSEVASCVADDVLYELCVTLAQNGFSGCIEQECQFDLAEPPCPVQCRDDAETMLSECAADSPDWQKCAPQSLQYAEDCINTYCDVPPVCDDTCESVLHADPEGDAEFRETDRGHTGLFDPHHLGPIDMLDIRLGPWTPDDAYAEPFVGQYNLAGDFVRIDLRFKGLVNPPGSLGPSGYIPYQHGYQPLYGFVELDMDNDVDTGGEIEAPLLRYLGNVARFGGVPTVPRFFGRVAVDSTAFLRSFTDPPFIERSGEEFHLAFLGNEPVSIEKVIGDDNALFEAGETWVIWGRYFHRAHGYEDFSFVSGGAHAGEYMPVHPLRFSHDSNTDITTVTVVFPLTQEGSAAMNGDSYVEDIDSDVSNQASVQEALEDLQLFAQYLEIDPTGLPEEALIAHWADKNPSDYLDPRWWRVTANFGTAYAPPGAGSAYFVWTDVYPNPVMGDINGNGIYGEHDAQLIADWIAANDKNDGVMDQSAPLPLFANYFSVMDLDYDGVIDRRDVPITNGDVDHDGDSDLQDVAMFQRCFGNSTFNEECSPADFNRNEQIDANDTTRLRWALLGPQ